MVVQVVIKVVIVPVLGNSLFIVHLYRRTLGVSWFVSFNCRLHIVASIHLALDREVFCLVRNEVHGRGNGFAVCGLDGTNYTVYCIQYILYTVYCILYPILFVSHLSSLLVVWHLLGVLNLRILLKNCDASISPTILVLGFH